MPSNQSESTVKPPLIKYTRPSSYDFAPYLTQWIFSEESHREIYIQLNTDIDHPRWERMGRLLETAFSDFIHKPEFIDECLRLFKHKEEDPLLRITQIIKEQQR